MFATNGVASILGLRPEQLVGKSFYFCIAENCLQDAVRCIESAKANDSIAYLRFWYRDPLQDEEMARDASTTDDESSGEDEDEGGVLVQTEPAVTEQATEPRPSLESPAVTCNANLDPPDLEKKHSSRTCSYHSTDLDADADATDATDAIFDRPTRDHSSISLTPAEEPVDCAAGIELEASVSCSSDGLVVVLRRARPLVPHALGATNIVHYTNGLFASPWATEPVLPDNASVTILPEIADPPDAERELAGFMRTIREISVFAWSLTGINGTIAEYGRGTPKGEALPPGGLPVWDPSSGADPENKYNGFLAGSHRPIDEEAHREGDETAGSEDEGLWKRVPVMPAWRRPARRGREEAFGDRSEEKGEEKGGEEEKEGEEGRERAVQRRKLMRGQRNEGEGANWMSESTWVQADQL